MTLASGSFCLSHGASPIKEKRKPIAVASKTHVGPLFHKTGGSPLQNIA